MMLRVVICDEGEDGDDSTYNLMEVLPAWCWRTLTVATINIGANPPLGSIPLKQPLCSTWESTSIPPRVEPFLYS